jgi:lipopolysaccharide export system protein LptA
VIRRFVCFLILIVVLMVPGWALGQPPVQDEPIQVTSDRLEADEAARQMKFIGNVVARQGDVVIYAQELLLFLGEDTREVERIEATRDVRVVQGERIATGQKGIFYRNEGRIVLSGSPRVHQGEDFIEGDEITVFLYEERSVVKGREGTPVKAIFHPKAEGR